MWQRFRFGDVRELQTVRWNVVCRTSVQCGSLHLSHVEIPVWEGHVPNILRAVTAPSVGLDKLSGDVRSTIQFTLYHVAVSQMHSRPAQHDRSLYSFDVCRTVHRRLRSKCDGTRAEIKFRLSAKRISPFQSAGGRQFSRILAAGVCALAIVMLDTPCTKIV